MNEVIADEHVVLIHYTLSNAAGEPLDSSREGPPLAYLHGAGNLVPGLEREMTGRAVGDSFDVVVPAKEGFGERLHDPFAIPRDKFPSDMEIQPGMDLMMEDASGNRMPLWVLEADEQAVKVDPNHPLAGLELHFAVEVVSIREATADELDHGHPHGPDGQHHHQ